MFGKVCTFLYCLLVVAATVIGVKVNVVKVSVEDKMFVLTDIESTTVYEQITENTMKCDLATFSNIINRMNDEGYLIVKSEEKEDSIDITLNKDRELYRMVYNSDGDFVSLGSQYEKSFVPLTYIIEE